MKFKFKNLLILLTFFVMALSTSGVYAGWVYQTGGVDGDSGNVNVDINEFTFPEYTVNFYTFDYSGYTGTYAPAPTLRTSFTYYNDVDTFTFPDKVADIWTSFTDADGNESSYTLKCWSTKRMLVEGDYPVYSNDESLTPGTMDNINGPIYEPGGTYKRSDLEWPEDNILSLYEICNETWYILGAEPEYQKIVRCTSDGHDDPPVEEFDYTIPTDTPDFAIYNYYGGDTLNAPNRHRDGLYITYLQYGDVDSGEITKIHTGTNPTILNKEYYNYKIILPDPEDKIRVTLEDERDVDFVDPEARTVYYREYEPIKLFTVPGSSFEAFSGSTVVMQEIGNYKYDHSYIPEVVLNGVYTEIDERQGFRNAYDDNVGYYNGQGTRNFQIQDTALYRWNRYFHDPCGKDYIGECLVEGTPILTADGTYVPVEEVQAGDELIVFNHETGMLDVSTVMFNDSHEEDLFKVVQLNFDNGKEIGVIYEHGFFDLDLGKYVYINEDNAHDFIGHEFYGINGERIKLASVSIYEKEVAWYSPVSAYHFNYFVDGLLSIPADIDGFINIFDYDPDLKYNEENKAKDIEKYGLFTYEDFKDYLPSEIFYAFNGPYMKVSIGKGLTTLEEILELIERYQKFWS